MTASKAQEAALTNIILQTLRGEITQLDEAQGKYEMDLERRFLGVDWKLTKTHKREGLLLDGQRWLNHFWLLEMPSIKARHSGATCEAEFKFRLSGKKTLRAMVQIVDAGYLGWIRCAAYRLPASALRTNLYYSLAAAVANCMNTYVLVFARGAGEMVRRRWVMSSSRRSEALARADEALHGIKRHQWRPVDMEADWCAIRECPWYRPCHERWSESEEER